MARYTVECIFTKTSPNGQHIAGAVSGVLYSGEFDSEAAAVEFTATGLGFESGAEMIADYAANTYAPQQVRVREV